MRKHCIMLPLNPSMSNHFFDDFRCRFGTRGGSNIDPQSIKNHRKSSQIDPKSSQNRPKSTQNRQKSDLGALRGAQGVRGRKLMENVGSWVLARAPVFGHLGDIFTTWLTFSLFLGVKWVVRWTIAVLMAKVSESGRPDVAKP